MMIEQGNPLCAPLSRYLSDPLLPLCSEFRGTGVDLAGIERPLRAFPGRKREHGQRGCHKRKGPSLENGQPEGGKEYGYRQDPPALAFAKPQRAF